MTARFLRNSMLSELKADYVRTAYSKGCTDQKSNVSSCASECFNAGNHLYGYDDRRNLAGSIVIEQVFGLPGDREASDQLGFHQRFPGCGDPDPVYYFRCDLCIFSGRYPVPPDRSPGSATGKEWQIGILVSFQLSDEWSKDQ